MLLPAIPKFGTELETSLYIDIKHKRYRERVGTK